MKKNDIRAVNCCTIFKGTDAGLTEELLGTKKYTVKTYARGEDIYSPEDYQKSLGVILKGTAEVSKDTGGGRLFMSRLKEGSVFGMSCIFCADRDFPTRITAVDSTRVLFITKQQLTELFFRYPVILENYLGILSSKIHFLNQKIESISAPDAAAALRQYLTELAAKSDTSSFSLPVSAQKLSSILGIGRTSVYRAFDKLISEGFIEKNGKVITITERN